MKKIFAFLFALCCIFVAQAQDVQSLDITKTSGTTEQLAVKNVKKITFADGNMVVTKADGNTASYVITEINKITFGTVTVDGIVNKAIGTDKFVSYSSDKNVINFKGEGTAQVYNVKGQLIKSVSVKGNSSLNIADLTKGVYVIKLNNQSAKIVKL